MRYAVLSFLCVVTVIAYIQRSAFNGATRAIELDLGVDSSDIGYILGGWYLAYALFQLPSGWFADRVGSKRALLLYATSWSLFTGLTGLAMGFPGLLLIWVLMGMAQAGIFPCCTKAIGATFPRTEQAFASGMLACCMSLGAALAPAITSQLIGPLSWQHIFAIYAIPGAVWVLLFALVIPRPDAPPVPKAPVEDEEDWSDEDEEDRQALPPATPADSSTTESAWIKLLTDRQMLLLCIQQFFRAGPMVIFFTWFARVLAEARGLSQSDAAWYAFWPPLVGAFGGVLCGLLSDWLLKRTGNPRIARQGMTFVLLVTGTVVALGAYLSTDPLTSVVLMCIANFCGMGGGVSGYSIAMSYGGKRVATVFATMNMSGNIGASFFPIAVGWIVAKTKDWNTALLLFAAMFATGAVLWTMLNPKGTLFAEGEEQK
jgi:sugar phosphate permease